MGKIRTEDNSERVLYIPANSLEYELVHRGNLALEHIPTSKVPEKGLISGKYYNFGNVTKALNLKFAPVKEMYVGVWFGEFSLQAEGSVSFPFNIKWPESTPKLEAGYRYMFQVVGNIGTLTKVAL